MYCGERANTDSDEDMSNLLSAFDDDSDDEVVEFIHSSLRNSSSNGLLGEDVINRNRAIENGAFDDVDLTLLPDENNRFKVREEDEFSPPWLYSRTICLFVSFVALGIVMGILGPSLLDLKIQTCSTSEEIPYLFTLRSIGYLLGSMLGGYLFDRFNSYLILSLSCLMAGITVGITSMGASIYTLLVIVFLQGACLGSLDTGANVLVIFLWKKKAAPYMQALHFMFAVGTFLAPLITKPFLLEHRDVHPLDNNTNTTQNYPQNMDDLYCEDLQEDLQIKWAYLLAALPHVASGLVFLMFSCIKMPYKKPTKSVEPKSAAKISGDKILKVLVMFSLGMLFFLYVGSEIMYGGFVFSFLVKSELHFSKPLAADVTAAFWGSMAVMRFLSIFISHYVSSFKMILADLIGCVLASLILMIWGNSSAASVWLGSILMGSSMASLYPSAVTWAEKLVEINGRIISLLINFSAFGEMILPLVAGSILAKYGAATFVFSVGISILLTFGSFCSTILLNKKRNYSRSEALTAHFQRLRDADSDYISNMGNEEIAKLLEHTDDLIQQEMERESIL